MHKQATRTWAVFAVFRKVAFTASGNGGPYGQRGWVGLVAVRWAADPHAGSAVKLASDAGGFDGGFVVTSNHGEGGENQIRRSPARFVGRDLDPDRDNQMTNRPPFLPRERASV